MQNNSEITEDPKARSSSSGGAARPTTHLGYKTIEEDRKEEAVREIFDVVAPAYDLLNDLLSFGMHRWWKLRCIRQAGIKPGMRVLDIASGTCDLAIEFARRAGAGCVTATDINETMLHYGAKRIRDAGVDARVVVADAERMPFAADSFDVATVSFGIRNMTHKDIALREMLRVLRPGGRLLVLEFSQCQRWLKPFYDFYSFHLMPKISQWVAGDGPAYQYLVESIRMHPNQSAFAAMMREAGFEDVKWKNFTFGICALHLGRKPETSAR